MVIKHPDRIFVKDIVQADIALKIINEAYGTDYIIKESKITLIPLGLECILGPKERE